ncbi:MAG: helix-turn-helix domain-containing protein [Flavobacteriales bacterium]|nr:helix-turn-helix domain-containing protein [Flavobacteriales bacterium]
MIKNNKSGKNLFKGNLLKNLLQEMQEIEKIRVETKFNLANNIEALLKNKGISKSEFAALMGKSPSEISKWLSGKHNFTIDTLMEIAHALRTDLTELLKFKPEPLFKTEVKVERRKPKSENKSSEAESFDDFELLE